MVSKWVKKDLSNFCMSFDSISVDYASEFFFNLDCRLLLVILDWTAFPAIWDIFGAIWSLWVFLAFFFWLSIPYCLFAAVGETTAVLLDFFKLLIYLLFSAISLLLFLSTLCTRIWTLKSCRLSLGISIKLYLIWVGFGCELRTPSNAPDAFDYYPAEFSLAFRDIERRWRISRGFLESLLSYKWIDWGIFLEVYGCCPLFPFLFSFRTLLSKVSNFVKIFDFCLFIAESGFTNFFSASFTCLLACKDLSGELTPDNLSLLFCCVPNVCLWGALTPVMLLKLAGVRVFDPIAFLTIFYWCSFLITGTLCVPDVEISSSPLS